VGWDRHKLLCDGTDKYAPWTILGISVPLCSSVVPSEQIVLRNASVNLRLGLQGRYQTFCYVSFCSPVSSEISDLLFFVSYFASQSKGIKLVITF